jgi:threonine synthase
VPAFLSGGRFEPRRSIRTLANAMDVGHPSNFERMLWLYDGDVDAMRRDIRGTVTTDDGICATIRRVYDARGYLLDPHSAIGYQGIVGRDGQERREGRDGQAGIFLATAHPAKFAEIVEPIIGRPIDMPPPLADALARTRHILRIDASLDAVKTTLHG